MKNAYLIVDIGTGSIRVAAVDAVTGKILTIERDKTKIYSDLRAPRAQYFLPGEMLETITGLVRQVAFSSGGLNILGLTATSFREGIVLTDIEGEALAGYTNGDRRGEAYMQDLDWERIHQLTGLEKSAIYSGIKMMGARVLDPEVYEKTAHITSVSDWVGFALTGKLVWERAQSMHSALYDPVRDTWSEELCAMMGLSPAILPPLAAAGTVLGTICPEVCDKMGLPEGTPYITGTADTQAALIPWNVKAGDIVMVSGTSSPCVRISDSFRVVDHSWISPTAVPGQFMTEVNTFSCGITLQRFKDLFLSDLSYRELDEDAVRLGLPERGLPMLHAIFMNGMHVDRPTSEGGFVMLNPMNPETRREDFFHAISLNIGMSIALCIQRHKEIDPQMPDCLIGVGGGLVSPVIAQTVADLTGMPVRIPAGFRESTVLGQSALCADALGLSRPVSEGEDRMIRPLHSDALENYFKEWKLRRARQNGWN